MKSFARLRSLVLALGTAELFTGCSNWSNVTQRARPASDFEVVETSSKRLLTAKEMVQLKAAVGKYLEKQGAVDSGDYYVKVFLAPDKDGVPADWVVVRFTRDTEMHFQLLGSDDAYSSNYRSYASYDYYPYGYDNFGRISFQYYDDPFYGSRYYYPPQRGNHDRNHDRDHDGDHNQDHNDRPPTPNPPRFKPIDPVGSPQVTQTRWDGNPPARNDQPSERNFPRHGGTPRPQQQPDRTSERNDSPPMRTSSQSAPQSEPVRSEPARSEPPMRTSSRSEPSYSPPASRSEPSQDSSSSQSQRETNQAAAQRERLEN